MPHAQRGDEIVVSLCEQWWVLPLTDKVSVWDQSISSMPGRDLLLDDEAQLVGYLLGFTNIPLVWDAGNALGVIRNTVNETSVSTATPDWCAVLTYGEHRENSCNSQYFASTPRLVHASRVYRATRDFSYFRNGRTKNLPPLTFR